VGEWRKGRGEKNGRKMECRQLHVHSLARFITWRWVHQKSVNHLSWFSGLGVISVCIAGGYLTLETVSDICV